MRKKSVAKKRVSGRKKTSTRKKTTTKKKHSRTRSDVKKARRPMRKSSKRNVTRKPASKKSIKKTTRKTVRKSVGKKSSKKTTTKKTMRIPTGISTFDSLTNGGFEKNSTNLVVGASGSGKSIFAMQFLLGGLKRGEKCLYVTFEEDKEQVYQHMAQFGWDLAEYERKGKFIFLEYTPGRVKTMLEEGGGAIESILLTQKVSRIVIDSITSFELLFERELEKREAALSLFDMIAKWNCTSLLTLEGAPSQNGSLGSRTIEFESDAIILLYYPRSKRNRERFMEILKMRGTKHSKGIHKFTMDEKGIVIQTRPSSVKF